MVYDALVFPRKNISLWQPFVVKYIVLECPLA